MDIDIRPAKEAPSITRVTITGRIDSYTLERVSEEIESLIRIGSNRLVCSLAGVDFVSGAGLKTFLKIIQQARKGGGDFKLCGLQPPVAKIFDLAGFTAIAEIYPSEAAALAAFGVGGGDQAFEKTMVAGDRPGGDPYDQTMVAPGTPGQGFEATLIAPPQGDKGFEATLVDEGLSNKGASDKGAPDKGFEATLLEEGLKRGDQGAAAGFEKTLVETPGTGPGKAGDARQPPADKGASGAQDAKRDQEAPRPGQADEQTFQTVMTRIDEIEETIVAPGGVGAGAEEPPLPRIEPICVCIPAELAAIEPVSHLVGAVGALVGLAKMQVVKFGMATTEVLRAIVRHGPQATRVDCSIEAKQGKVSVTLQPDGQAFELFHVLRPQMESQINTPAEAKEWLEKLATRVDVQRTGGAPRIVLTKST